MAKQKTKLGKPKPSTAGLPQKAALVLFNASQWTARVADLKVTRKVISDAGAIAEAGRFNKSLLPGDALVKAIAKNISEFRQDYLYTVTLPWGDDGWRLIPAQRISEFRAKFRHHEDIHNQLVQDFLASYEDKIEKAKVDLAGLFSRTEYPSLEAVTAKYRFKLDWNSIADADDLRVQISEEASGEIRKAITEATEAKLSRAVAETHKRAHEVVTAVVDRLTEDENGDHKIFRDSLIGNIRDLAEILPSLNVTNDPTLAKVAEDLHNKLGKLDPEVLRNEPAAAKAAVKTAQDILAELSGAI